MIAFFMCYTISMNRLHIYIISILFIILNNIISANFPESDSLALEKEALHLYYQAKDSTKDPAKAIDAYKRAIKISLKINNYNIVEYCYGRISELYLQDSSFSKAIDNINMAIQYSSGNKKVQRITQKAYIYYIWGKYNLSLENLNIAEKESIKNNDLVDLSEIYYQRSQICFNIDLYELAEKTVDKMVQLSKKIKIKKMDRLYTKLADLNRKKKKYKKAIQFFQKSLTCAPFNSNSKYWNEWKSYTLNKIGDCYSELNDPDKAIYFYKQAYAAADFVHSYYWREIVLLDLCQLNIRNNNLKLAKNYLIKLDSLKNPNEQLKNKIRRNAVLGRFFLLQNMLDSSLFYYKKSLSFFEKEVNTLTIENARSGLINDRSKRFNNISDIYKRLIDSEKYNPAYYDSLFKYNNVVRSRTLSEKKTRDSIHDSLYSDAVIHLKKFQRNIRLSVRDSAFNYTQQLNGLKYQLLNEKLYQLTDHIKKINQISLSEFKTYLQQTESSAAIYNLGKTEQYILFINSSHEKIINLNIQPEELSLKLHHFLSGAFYKKDPQQNEFNTELAYELYLKLWKPLEDKVQLTKNIIIIPDNPINTLPFDILLDKPDRQIIYKSEQSPDYTKNLLINKYNFAILPSANLIKSFKDLVTNNQSLIVANPDFSPELNINPEIETRTGWSFNQLIYSKAEAKATAAILKNARVLEQSDATVKNILKYASKSDIIHLATHAFVDSVFNMFSGLVVSLSDDPSDDGFLMGYQISNLSLNCDLVTLSACESGQGNIYINEGIMGLPRLFFAAGSRSILMTLWEVNDKISADLIPHFYSNLIKNKMSKIEALGEAKRYILTKYRVAVNGIFYNNPFYWAPFILYGDVKNNLVHPNHFHIYLYLLFFLLIIFSVIYYKKWKYRQPSAK